VQGTTNLKRREVWGVLQVLASWSLASVVAVVSVARTLTLTPMSETVS
jgi:hypothetical protein